MLHGPAWIALRDPHLVGRSGRQPALEHAAVKVRHDQCMDHLRGPGRKLGLFEPIYECVVTDRP